MSYLIVGAGAFGASTALELKRVLPSAKVTLIDRTDFPNPSAASHDQNKIIRADYGDILYMRLALEAQEYWRTDPIYKPYYHESGMLYAENKGMAQSFLKNYEQLGIKPESYFMSPKEAKLRFSGAFRHANWTGVEQTYFNPRSGWGEGANALRSLTQAALEQGVIYRTATVSRLALSSSDECKGVILDNGEQIDAEHIILSMGAWLPMFLAETAPGKPDLQVGERMVAAGAIQCCASVPIDQLDRIKDVPVLFNAESHTEGEAIPPTAERILKFNYEVSFTNKYYHELSKQTISIPPKRKSRSTWSHDVPTLLKEEIQTVMRHTYGCWMNGFKIEHYRMCWDAVTPNQDFVIGPHPHCKGLYIAGGGSFHAWKFMPTLGKYVVQMLQCNLPDELGSRWAWDRPENGGALPEYLPHRDLKEIAGYEPDFLGLA